MFRRRTEEEFTNLPEPAMDRVTSVLGAGTSFNGRLTGSGGIRIEGAFEGEIELRGLLVIGESGRVTCEQIQAAVVVIAGVVKGSINAEKVEVRATGRVWGDVATAAFSTEEGAFLQGQITMMEPEE
jgi:cytoskeletal protein CcmA (bactofilin family)